MGPLETINWHIAPGSCGFALLRGLPVENGNVWMPVSLVSTSILIHHGTLDKWFPVRQAHAFDQLLTTHGIGHEYVETPTYFFQTLDFNIILQFMSENLVFEAGN